MYSLLVVGSYGDKERIRWTVGNLESGIRGDVGKSAFKIRTDVTFIPIVLS